MREDNFSHVCLSLPVEGTGGRASHVTITQDALDLTIQGLPSPGADTWWLATEACMVGEQAVRILLVKTSAASLFRTASKLD